MFAYEQCLLCLGHHPDIWLEAASYLVQSSKTMAEKGVSYQVKALQQKEVSYQAKALQKKSKLTSKSITEKK